MSLLFSKIVRLPIRRPAVLAGYLISFVTLAFGQSDDFNSGTDAGWKRFNPLSVVGVSPTFSFPDDGLGGKAYRLESPAPPVANAGPARTFTYRTNVYSDFYAAVDVIAWDNTLNQAFGILFRAETIGLGTTTGYVMNYDPQQAAGGRGQIQFNRVFGEASNGTIGAANISLEPGRRYRFVMTAVGSEFTGRVYDLADLTAPLVTFTASESTYAQGVVGLFNFYRGNQTTSATAGRADTTFDNYFVSATPPTSVPPPGTPHSLPSYPYLVTRTPVTRAHLFAATNGVTFTVRTAPTSSVQSATLILNGRSSSLFGVGTETERTFRASALESNQVYDAQIIVQDTVGRTITNSWTFDTFSEDFLSSTNVKVIEAEDYNFENGKFQENPEPSGFSSTGAQVNGSGTGYLDLVGTPEVDYFDRSSLPGSGAVADYRAQDLTGTQDGSSETGRDNQFGGPDPAVNDFQRRKYAALDLPEYQVRGTEGGEWLNYTRTFTAGDYQVFLRVAGRSTQVVHLDRVAGDPTSTNQTTTALGTFQVPNLGMLFNYRYVPLVDTNGNRVTVHLSGKEAIRLTLGGIQQDATKYTMALNYLLFVPAAAAPVVQLELASAVNGPYALDATATTDTAAGTITTTPRLREQFYRVRVSGASPSAGVRITRFQVTGQTLVLNYQLTSTAP